MKRKLCLILSCILLLAAVIPTSVFASDVSLFNNNTSRNYTSFTITDSGEARVAYKYEGYEGITKGYQRVSQPYATAVHTQGQKHLRLHRRRYLLLCRLHQWSAKENPRLRHARRTL